VFQKRAINNIFAWDDSSTCKPIILHLFWQCAIAENVYCSRSACHGVVRRGELRRMCVRSRPAWPLGLFEQAPANGTTKTLVNSDVLQHFLFFQNYEIE